MHVRKTVSSARVGTIRIATKGAAMPLQAVRQSSQTPLTQANNNNVKFTTKSGHYSHNVRFWLIPPAATPGESDVLTH